MQKRLCYIAAALGLAAVVTAAGASCTGMDLLYTVPAGILGALIARFGVTRARSIRRPERMKRRNRMKIRARLAREAELHG